jgi:hypothetical protein
MRVETRPQVEQCDFEKFKLQLLKVVDGVDTDNLGNKTNELTNATQAIFLLEIEKYQHNPNQEVIKMPADQIDTTNTGVYPYSFSSRILTNLRQPTYYRDIDFLNTSDRQLYENTVNNLFSRNKCRRLFTSTPKLPTTLFDFIDIKELPSQQTKTILSRPILIMPNDLIQNSSVNQLSANPSIFYELGVADAVRRSPLSDQLKEPMPIDQHRKRIRRIETLIERQGYFFAYTILQATTNQKTAIEEFSSKIKDLDHLAASKEARSYYNTNPNALFARSVAAIALTRQFGNPTGEVTDQEAEAYIASKLLKPSFRL